jgi:hypothetical protein
MAGKPLVSDSTLGRAVKTTLDIGVPGFSLYTDGEIGEGAVHTLLGLAAGIAIGPPGVWLVAANSIARSNSGKNLWEFLGSHREERREHREEHREHAETRGRATKH